MGVALATLLTKETFEKYLIDSRVKALPVEGLSKAKILIDPLNGKVSLQLIADKVPDLALSERMSWESITVLNDGHFGELVVWAQEQMFEAYLLIADIAAEFVSLGSLQLALVVATSRFTELLELGKALSFEKQLGLAGELLVIQELLAKGVDDPLASWLGPGRSEHDFKFQDFDLEIKTTSSEGRNHKIANIFQLVPSSGRKLFLVSIQLTTAGENSGFTLSDLVRGLAKTAEIRESVFSEKLTAAGWRADHSHLYSARFELRSEPAVFEVNHEFPRLTPEDLGLNADSSPRVSDVSYRLNLDGLSGALSLKQIIARGV